MHSRGLTCLLMKYDVKLRIAGIVEPQNNLSTEMAGLKHLCPIQAALHWPFNRSSVEAAIECLPNIAYRWAALRLWVAS